MTTTINASTSSGLVVTPDNSGNVLLQYNGQSAPAFFAYKSTNQNSTGGANTKVTFDTEVFDTNSNFASDRFTPTVAGYYQLNANVFYTNSVSGYALLSFWKNGADFVRGPQMQLTTAAYNAQSISNIIYFNGTTDYVEVYTQTGSTATMYGVVGTPYLTNFSGCLLRGA
jgi:hypothetical protein